MSNRIKAELRLEELTKENNGTGAARGGRVWYDVTIDGAKAQSQVWYSGPYSVAEQIFSGELMINDKSEVVPGPNARVETTEDDSDDPVFVFTGQRNPTPHW